MYCLSPTQQRKGKGARVTMLAFILEYNACHPLDIKRIQVSNFTAPDFIKSLVFLKCHILTDMFRNYFSEGHLSSCYIESVTCFREHSLVEIG